MSNSFKQDFGNSSLALRTQRCLFHARTGFEHVVYMLACARLGVLYSCTSVDASDAVLAHRIYDFRPTFYVVSSDTQSVSRTNPDSHSESRVRETHNAIFRADSGDGTPSHIQVYCVSQGDVLQLLIKNRHLSSSKDHVAASRPTPVIDSHALCVVYTSGSTGKPKGIVHGHSGYGACVSRSMQYVFSATPNDKLLVVATFAWITGQSYMLLGPLLAGCTSVLIDGSPLGIDGLRWAHIARACNATLLKLASAFVRHAMADSRRGSILSKLNLASTLRLATFCAEPVSTDVQVWASHTLCACFINSYWATEHGSIVLTWQPGPTCCFCPDTKCWPVPWVKCELAISNPASRNAPQDIVLVEPYAGLMRTVWGDVEGYVQAAGVGDKWVGDIDRFKASYFSLTADSLGFGFVQGDAARVDPLDNGWTFHGRSDEVLNVSGVRVGVEEIEKVLW